MAAAGTAPPVRASAETGPMIAVAMILFVAFRGVVAGISLLFLRAMAIIMRFTVTAGYGGQNLAGPPIRPPASRSTGTGASLTARS